MQERTHACSASGIRDSSVEKRRVGRLDYQGFDQDSHGSSECGNRISSLAIDGCFARNVHCCSHHSFFLRSFLDILEIKWNLARYLRSLESTRYGGSLASSCKLASWSQSLENNSRPCKCNKTPGKRADIGMRVGNLS